MPENELAINQPQDRLAKLDKAKLANHIVQLMSKDIQDREMFGWTTMREYDQLSYDGYKQKATEPWFNAANFPVPLTPTLLDTGVAHVINSIWSNPKDVVKVEGVGPEDERSAKNVEAFYAWKIHNDIDGAYNTIESTVRLSFKHANGYIKVIHGSGGIQKPKVIWANVPVENIFLPVNAKGAQPSQTDHIIELIPLSENDIQTRKALKKPDGSPFYDGIGDIPKGNTVALSTAINAMQNVRDVTSGTSLGNKYSRDMRYIAECYLTYYEPMEDGSLSEPLELIAWISPNGGKLLNVVLNPDFDESTGEYIRPYSTKWTPYPREDRHYGDSLPWRIKPIQEELDYAHNQNLNAAEIAIKPPKFYRAGSGFDPELYEATPDGWYPVANPQQDIYIPTFNVNPIFERQEDKYWDLAERLTGFTELFQGRAPDTRQTATLTINRENKSEVRFKTIYNRFSEAFNELMQLTYFYDRKYTPSEVKIKAIGFRDYKSIKELFPNGFDGRYNFFFKSETIVEQERKKQEMREFYAQAVANPIVAMSPGNQWKLLETLAESYGIRNLDSIITKPEEADILSPEESIRRLMSGQLDLQPNVNINPADYLMKFEMFMRTDTFMNLEREFQFAFIVFIDRVKAIQEGQALAANDLMVQQEFAMAQAQMANALPEGESQNEQVQ